MATVTNTAEGQTSGTGLTTGNSGGGSGDAFGQVSITGGTGVYSNLYAAFGTNSYRCTAIATQTVILIWQGYSVTSMSARYYFQFQSLPTGGDVQLFQFRNSGGNAMFLQMSTTGQLKVGNTASSLVNVTSAICTASTPYWVETAVIVATSTTGTAKCTLHANDGSNTVVGTPYSVTNFNAGTTNLTNARFGKPNSSNALDVFIDQMTLVDGSSTLIGPYVPPATPPTAAGVGSSNYYSFDARSSTDGTGGTLTYTIAQDSGTTFTAIEVVDGFFLVEREDGANRVYTVTVTESPSGLTDTIQFTAPALVITVGSNDLVYISGVWT